MIAKNIKAQAFVGVVNYVIKKDAEMLKAEGVMAMSAKDMITSFELQRSVRPEIKSPVGHIPISFSPEDKERMTNEFMVQLAEEYMENMGIKDTQYIIVRHHDNPNEHIHIVYNRIDNNGELITDKNDYKRNVDTCKRLKDKYNLTYGKNKFKVRREKLRGTERIKHDIYHAIREEIVRSRDILELQKRLNSRGIEINIKFRRGTMEPQGISFTKDNVTFKGSQIDRNFSLINLMRMLEAVNNEYTKRETQQLKHKFKHKIPTTLGGVKLTEEQRINLDNGKSVYIDNLTDRQGNICKAWLKLSDSRDKLDFYSRDPDTPRQITQQSSPQEQHQEGAIISGGLGIFDLPANGGDDPDETQFRNRMQRQQKKKRGRRM